ncbi:MAG: hypothetical protein K0R24_147 [Gammaproteobacteria bacterium]|jgi:hypothetical protein|nr:hypothetical protein [Gammaproteobacteria bacterium]
MNKIIALLLYLLSINVLADQPFNNKNCNLGTDCVFHPYNECITIYHLKQGEYSCHITQKYSTVNDANLIVKTQGRRKEFPDSYLEKGEISEKNISLSVGNIYDGYEYFTFMAVYKNTGLWNSLFNMYKYAEPKTEITVNCRKL